MVIIAMLFIAILSKHHDFSHFGTTSNFVLYARLLCAAYMFTPKSEATRPSEK